MKLLQKIKNKLQNLCQKSLDFYKAATTIFFAYFARFALFAKGIKNHKIYTALYAKIFPKLMPFFRFCTKMRDDFLKTTFGQKTHRYLSLCKDKIKPFATKIFITLKTYFCKYLTKSCHYLKANKICVFVASFCAICVVLAFLGVFGLGVRFGVNAILDSSLSAQKSSFLHLFASRDFVASSLAKSNLAIVPKDYLDSLKNTQNLAHKKQQESQAKNLTPPQMPNINEGKKLFYGNYSLWHALNLAQSAILERDFIRARTWIYNAWDMQEDSASVWELYLQSYEEDAGVDDETKAQARRLFHSAKEYYGF